MLHSKITAAKLLLMALLIQGSLIKTTPALLPHAFEQPIHRAMSVLTLQPLLADDTTDDSTTCTDSTGSGQCDPPNQNAD